MDQKSCGQKSYYDHPNFDIICRRYFYGRSIRWYRQCMGVETRIQVPLMDQVPCITSRFLKSNYVQIWRLEFLHLPDLQHPPKGSEHYDASGSPHGKEIRS